jgi:hypothetical protein
MEDMAKKQGQEIKVGKMVKENKDSAEIKKMLVKEAIGEDKTVTQVFSDKDSEPSKVEFDAMPSSARGKKRGINLPGKEQVRSLKNLLHKKFTPKKEISLLCQLN